MPASVHVDTKPAPPETKNKFRKDSTAAKPSGKLRRESDQAPNTAGQLGLMTDGKCKPDKKAERESRRIDKSKLRFKKTGDKLDVAREKLAKQKPVKPPGVIKTFTQAVSYEVWANAHGKIHQVENENVAVEAAHNTELYGERVGRAAIRYVRNRNRTRPIRRVRKMVRQARITVSGRWSRKTRS